MNRSEILMVITLIVSLTTLWFSWKLYSEKNKKVVENFGCGGAFQDCCFPGQCFGDYKCSWTNKCLPPK